jgi:hypothetical protein
MMTLPPGSHPSSGRFRPICRGGEAVAATASRSRGRSGAECHDGDHVRSPAFRCKLTLRRQQRAGLRAGRKRSGTCSNGSAKRIRACTRGLGITYHLKSVLLKNFLKDCPSPRTESRVSFTFSKAKLQHQHRALSAPFEQHSNHPE